MVRHDAVCEQTHTDELDTLNQQGLEMTVLCLGSEYLDSAVGAVDDVIGDTADSHTVHANHGKYYATECRGILDLSPFPSHFPIMRAWCVVLCWNRTSKREMR